MVKKTKVEFIVYSEGCRALTLHKPNWCRYVKLVKTTLHIVIMHTPEIIHHQNPCSAPPQLLGETKTAQHVLHAEEKKTAHHHVCVENDRRQSRESWHHSDLKPKTGQQRQTVTPKGPAARYSE